MRHGGDLSEAMARFGGTSADWLDLSTGINPHAYPHSSLVTAEDWTRLPAPSAHDALVETARTAYQVPETMGVVAASGTQALIAQLPRLVSRTSVAIVSPTYASHAESWASAGHAITAVPSVDQIPQHTPYVVVASPNNPTGAQYNPQDLLTLARTLHEREGMLIVDEAFADSIPASSLLPHIQDESVVVLRSFGKFYGLAGVRLGFMIAPGPVCRTMRERLGTWAVSGPALKIGHAALNDHDWQQTMRAQLAEEAQRLETLVKAAGFTVTGQTPLFTLISCEDAADLHYHLATRHIWTRLFDYSENWLRLGHPATEDEWQRLEQGLATFNMQEVAR